MGNIIDKLVSFFMIKVHKGLQEKETKLDSGLVSVPQMLQNQPHDIGPTFVCDFCYKLIHLENSFDIKDCAHFYCRPCIAQFIETNLQLNITRIMCPVAGCTGMLDPEYCRPILPNEVFDQWGDALFKSMLATENHIDSTFICDFCVEPNGLKDSFNIKGCSHFYCRECIVKFVVSKLQENVSRFSCPVPECSGVLDPEYCRPILPNDVFVRWGKALCESVVMTPQKYIYCPFNTCSALLIHDEGGSTKKSQCPHCRRVFCAECKVPWHSEFSCAEFQKLREKGDDKMLEELAKNKNWRRCPSCKYFVERKDGCSYIKCRCGYAFCYSCGIKAPLTRHTFHCRSCKK